MLAEDAEALCGPRHARSPERRGYRWGTTASAVAYQGGKVKVCRPGVRDLAGTEMSLPSWEALSDPGLLRAWATNLVVLNVSTRKYRRAVRLPEGGLTVAKGDATSKSAVSRRFVALTRKKLKAWLTSDIAALDLVVIQIDGLRVGDYLLVTALGVGGQGAKQVSGIADGATENAATVQALLDNLIARGLDPSLPRLFIVDGAKALSKAIRNTFTIAPPPSSAARYTRAATSSTAWTSISTPASKRRCAMPGIRMTPTRPSGCSRAWPSVSNTSRPASAPPSRRASMRPSP